MCADLLYIAAAFRPVLPAPDSYSGTDLLQSNGQTLLSAVHACSEYMPFQP